MDIEDLLGFYKQGLFPMATHREDDAFDIVAPYTRALLPIRNLHVPKRLRRTIRHSSFDVRFNTNFNGVIHACANAVRAKQDNTWINNAIIAMFLKLHDMGYAHSVECWDRGQLVGGLYGLALGSTFCGESMFSAVTDASKIALVHLCARLDRAGFRLLDSQFRNPHLDQFGLYEMPQDDYVRAMQAGLAEHPDFGDPSVSASAEIRDFLNLTA